MGFGMNIYIWWSYLIYT